MEERGIQNLKKIEALNARIDKEIIPKISEIQSELYKMRQDFHQLVDKYIAGLRKEIEELQSRIRNIETDAKK